MLSTGGFEVVVNNNLCSTEKYPVAVVVDALMGVVGSCSVGGGR